MEEQAFQNIEPEGLMAMAGTFAAVILVIALFMVVVLWKIFSKAGKPGWASIVPIYRSIVLLEIVGKPLWWIILFVIPGVNLVVIIIVIHKLSLSFGKDIAMTLLLLFIPIVGFPMLAFGNATYVGPAK